MNHVVICDCGWKVVTPDYARDIAAHKKVKHPRVGPRFHVEQHHEGMPTMRLEHAEARGHVTLEQAAKFRAEREKK